MGSLRDTFNQEALALVQGEIDRFRSELTFESARQLPRADGRDVVVAGKEVQLTVFSQTEPEFLKGRVLITVQAARFGLGGTNTFRLERGVIFSADDPPRDATETELAESGV